MNDMFHCCRRIGYRRIGVGLLGAALYSVALGAGAESKVQSYEMQAVGDDFDTRHFDTGDYAGAIARIESMPNTPASRYTNANNLCVAHTKLGNFDEAAVHCDEAVRLGKVASRIGMNGSEGKRDFSTALTNRGVMHALAERYGEAVADFDRAITLKLGTDAAQGNRVIAEAGLEALVASAD